VTGNEFVNRLTTIFYDSEKLPPDSAVKKVGRKRVACYIGIQVSHTMRNWCYSFSSLYFPQAGCLAILWILKSFKPTAMFFPSVIGGLVIIRRKVLPKFFTSKELDVLDSSEF